MMRRACFVGHRDFVSMRKTGASVAHLGARPRSRQRHLAADARPRRRPPFRTPVPTRIMHSHEVPCGKPMFFKQQRHPAHRRASASPRPTTCRRASRALLRESCWLLVVAAFAYLALILAQLYAHRSRLVVLRHRRRRCATAAASSAPGSPDLLLYLFGAVGVVVGGRRRGAGDRRLPARRAIPSTQSEHPLALGVAWASRWCSLASAALEAMRLWQLPATLPLAPGRRARGR